MRISDWSSDVCSSDLVFVVANRVHPNALEISRKDFEQSIEHKIDVLIPADPKLAAQAAKLGKTLAEVAKGNRIGHALENMMQLAMGAGEESVEGNIAGRNGKSLLRSEEHTSELQSLMRNSYAVSCLKKKKKKKN